MSDTGKTSLPNRLTLELNYDAKNPEQFEYIQGLLKVFLEKWNTGDNKFISEPTGTELSPEVF
jgi:hypothetical protein